MSIPMKAYWRGQDIDQLPRETLIEIIHDLCQQIEHQQRAFKSMIEVNELAARHRAHT